jgi:hypothetical protein
MSTPTYTLLASQTLGGSSSGITFSSIDQNYRDLVVIQKATANNDTKSFLRFNGDTGYKYDWITSDGAITYIESVATTSSFNLFYNGYGNFTIGSGSDPSMTIWQIFDYAETDKQKSLLVRSTFSGNVSLMLTGVWNDTSAVTSITFGLQSGIYTAGSTWHLYGIEA